MYVTQYQWELTPWGYQLVPHQVFVPVYRYIYPSYGLLPGQIYLHH